MMLNNLFADFPKLVFLLLLAGVTLLFGSILQPFFFAIFWAVLLAAAFAPVNRFFGRKFSNPNWRAGLTLLAVVITFVLPAGLILALLVGESIEIYNAMSAGGSVWIISFGAKLSALGQHPLLVRFDLDQQFITDKSVELLKTIADFLVSNLSALTENTILFLIEFAVMLYCLFYFLRDGDEMLDTIARYLPVDERHFQTFIAEFLVTSKATLKFTFVIGGIQGALGGLVFYITGIQSPLVWGVLMIGLSIVPAVGSAIIWAPAGVLMLLTGHVWQGLVILIFGALVISMVDNLLRPILLGKDIQMHSLLIFLSTLGGIAVFGFSGFVLGPVVAAFFLAIWKLFQELGERKTGKGPAEEEKID